MSSSFFFCMPVLLLFQFHMQVWNRRQRRGSHGGSQLASVKRWRFHGGFSSELVPAVFTKDGIIIFLLSGKHTIRHTPTAREYVGFHCGFEPSGGLTPNEKCSDWRLRLRSLSSSLRSSSSYSSSASSMSSMSSLSSARLPKDGLDRNEPRLSMDLVLLYSELEEGGWWW